MILSSSSGMPRNYAFEAKGEFLGNETMDVFPSGIGSEQASSPSLALPSPPPYSTPCFADASVTSGSFSQDETQSCIPTISPSSSSSPPLSSRAVKTEFSSLDAEDISFTPPSTTSYVNYQSKLMDNRSAFSHPGFFSELPNIPPQQVYYQHNSVFPSKTKSLSTSHFHASSSNGIAPYYLMKNSNSPKCQRTASASELELQSAGKLTTKILSKSLENELKEPSSSRKKRKACGHCEPCRRKENCETCMNCINRVKGKQICIHRKCEALKKKPGNTVHVTPAVQGQDCDYDAKRRKSVSGAAPTSLQGGIIHPTQHPLFPEFGDISYSMKHFARRNSMQDIGSPSCPPSSAGYFSFPGVNDLNGSSINNPFPGYVHTNDRGSPPGRAAANHVAILARNGSAPGLNYDFTTGGRQSLPHSITTGMNGAAKAKLHPVQNTTSGYPRAEAAMQWNNGHHSTKTPNFAPPTSPALNRDGSRSNAAGQLLSNLCKFNSPSSFNGKNCATKDAFRSINPCQSHPTSRNPTYSPTITNPSEADRSQLVFSCPLTSTIDSVDLSSILPSPAFSDSFATPSSCNAVPMDTGLSYEPINGGSLSEGLTHPHLNSTLVLLDNGYLNGLVGDEKKSDSPSLYGVDQLKPLQSTNQFLEQMPMSRASSNPPTISQGGSRSSGEGSQGGSLPQLSTALISSNNPASMSNFNFTKQLSAPHTTRDTFLSLSPPMSNQSPPSGLLDGSLDLNTDAFIGLDDSAHAHFTASLPSHVATSRLPLISASEADPSLFNCDRGLLGSNQSMSNSQLRFEPASGQQDNTFSQANISASTTGPADSPVDTMSAHSSAAGNAATFGVC